MIAVHIVGNPGGGSSPEPVHGRLYVSIKGTVARDKSSHHGRLYVSVKETVTRDKSNQFMDAFM